MERLTDDKYHQLAVAQYKELNKEWKKIMERIMATVYNRAFNGTESEKK